MRWMKWALAASLLFNVLAVGGYLYGLHALHREGWSSTALDLDPTQRQALAELRQGLRDNLKSGRRQLAPQLATLVKAIREARPGSDQLEPALTGLSQAHLSTRLTALRRIVAFRETLSPRQQERFNRLLARPGFVVDLLGFPRVAEAMQSGLDSSLSNPTQPPRELSHEKT